MLPEKYGACQERSWGAWERSWGTPESVAEASEAPESVAESSEIPILTYLFDNFPNPNGVCLQGDGYANCM